MLVIIVMLCFMFGVKIECICGFGVNVVLYGDILEVVCIYVYELVEKEGLIFVYFYDDEVIIVG